MPQELLGRARISTTSDIQVHVPENMAELATEIIAGELCCAQMVPMTEEHRMEATRSALKRYV